MKLQRQLAGGSIKGCNPQGPFSSYFIIITGFDQIIIFNIIHMDLDFDLLLNKVASDCLFGVTVTALLLTSREKVLRRLSMLVLL